MLNVAEIQISDFSAAAFFDFSQQRFHSWVQGMSVHASAHNQMKDVNPCSWRGIQTSLFINLAFKERD